MPDGMTIHGSLLPIATTLSNVEMRVKDVIKKAPFKLESIIVKHIQNQDLDWKELDDKYKDRKKKEGFSDLIWVRTGTALETVRVIKIDEDSFFVGWPRGVAETEDGEDIVNIAAVLEFGRLDGSIEARPVVGPSVEELNEWLQEQIAGAIKISIVKPER